MRWRLQGAICRMSRLLSEIHVLVLLMLGNGLLALAYRERIAVRVAVPLRVRQVLSSPMARLLTAEQHRIEGVLALDLRRLGTVMTPRHKVTWIDTEAGPERVLETLAASSHALYPVCRGSMDAVAGVVKARLLLAGYARGAPARPADVISPAVFIPDGVSTLDAMLALRAAPVHMALVVDE